MTGELLAIDYAWQHPQPGAIAEAGYTAVLRYVSQDPSKDLSATEAVSLHDAHLGIGLIFETTAQRALGSTVAGQQDGAAMLARLQLLGAPEGIPALVNVGDWSVQPEQVRAILAYYQAFRDQLGAYQAGAGGYGPGGLITMLATSWPGDIWWQNAINALGWSGSVVHPHASIYQRVSPTRALTGAQGSYDEDVYGIGPRPDLDWWLQPGSTPPPPPPPTDWWLQMPTIRQGATGPTVRTAQGLLLARYYQLGHTGPLGDGLDGDFGPLTDAAVREAQGAAHITVDGIIGPQTWPVLAGV